VFLYSAQKYIYVLKDGRFVVGRYVSKYRAHMRPRSVGAGRLPSALRMFAERVKYGN
jgi:hypothetical protein